MNAGSRISTATLIDMVRRNIDLQPAMLRFLADDCESAQRELAEARAQGEKLQRVFDVANLLKFSAYPAHGSGFVITVTGGNINDLEAALSAAREEKKP